MLPRLQAYWFNTAQPSIPWPVLTAFGQAPGSWLARLDRVSQDPGACAPPNPFAHLAYCLTRHDYR
ncbi:hypothetical protein [Hymenobacter rigui]|uniref:Uncharacterized protein n=1 Tax=Hymenobacter rigui TaxID=334424 RepID=A0A3R9MTY9_9BACT|nr:hypothetical protein [Hymenobacter rigui]RSK50054.1 hypothetical protein EI291_05225 [Hymenobacter rigui]